MSIGMNTIMMDTLKHLPRGEVRWTFDVYRVPKTARLQLLRKKVIRWESERSNWDCFLVYRDRCPRLLCVSSGNDVALQGDRCRHVDICMRTLRENHLVLQSTLFFHICCRHWFDLRAI